MTSEETRDELTALRAAYRRAMPRDAAELVAHRAMQGASSVGAQGRQNRRMLGAAAGLITLSAGTFGNVIRVLAPLVIGDDELAEGLDVLEQALG